MDAFTVNPQVDEAFEADMDMSYDPESDYEGGGDTGESWESWESWDYDQDLEAFSLECAFGPDLGL